MGDKPPTKARSRGRATRPAAEGATRPRGSAAGKGAAADRAAEAALGENAEEPEFVQLLTPDGERVEHPLYSVDFTDDEYRGLYRDLMIVRRLDAESTALQRQGHLAIWASLEGQEAAQVGSGRALRKQDMAFPTYREHGVLWCRGVDPTSPHGLFSGADHGSWDPYEHNFNLYTLVIGAQTLHAVGYAMGVNFDGKVGTDEGEAAIVYFGDGASSQGDVHEACVFAGVYHAPVVFFCQNNQYAISEPVERQTRTPIYKRADGYGFPGVRVDGNDVLACYAVTRHAMDQARHGQGPTFVEAYTYRMGPHTTTDDPTRYRIAGEVESWKLRDPILRLRTFLTKQEIADDAFFASVDADADAIVTRMRDRVINAPDGPADAFFDHVYAGDSPLLDAERKWFHEYQESFAGEAH
ncbi:MAG: pyruvate dehydrogenase (acetyl-transferring) E1 component subunit alpha [Actinocatenispora sp.]